MTLPKLFIDNDKSPSFRAALRLKVLLVLYSSAPSLKHIVIFDTYFCPRPPYRNRTSAVLDLCMTFVLLSLGVTICVKAFPQHIP